MDLENIQRRLFEKKLDIMKYFKVAFDVYREFLKSNKLLIFWTHLLVISVIGLDILNRYVITLFIKNNKDVKLVFYVVLLAILELILSIIQAFLIGYYFRKIVMGIEGENEFEIKKFFLKMLKFIGIEYCLLIVFLTVSQTLNQFYLSTADLVLRIMMIFIFFKYFLYFETYYVRNFEIIDSIKYSYQLSKENRFRKIIPGAVFLSASIIPVSIIASGVSQMFKINYFLGIVSTIIFIIIFVFTGIYLQTLNAVIFLNVEYDYLKSQERKNNENYE